jgi:hypothetical protein
MSWRDLPPTRKQVDFIQTWCHWVEDIPETRGECSDLISNTVDSWQKDAYTDSFSPMYQEYSNDDMDPDNPFGNDTWMFG